MNWRIFVAGVGGQGSITTTAIIGEAAMRSGLNATASEIHGMAQRGGVVESSVVVGDARSPLVPVGGADILLAMEPVEGARALSRCGPETVVLVNTHPIYPFTVSLGHQTYPDVDALIAEFEEHVASVHAFDAFNLARKAGNSKAAGSVMLGALCGLDLLPIPEDRWLESILDRVPKRATEANRRAFQAGREITRAGR